jgi:carboxyl-terminal processing protease
VSSRRLAFSAWLRAAACAVAICAPLHTHAGDAREFDATRAWDEFSQLLRLDYSYFARPGVDGGAILAHFAERARASRDRREFIELAKTVARNFADPHLNVGPSAPTDPALVPTASDLSADWLGGRAVIRAVRSGSDAAAQGVPVGATVVAINGRDAAAAVEALLGRPAHALSREQLRHGLNMALAGVRDQARELVLGVAGGAPRSYRLQATSVLAHAVAAAPAVASERRGAIGLIRFNNSLGRNETAAQFKAALESVLDTRALVIDLRNTPSGGNSTVARAVLGHFVAREQPYQVHVVSGEERRFGVPRKFIELVAPLKPHYRGRVFVLAGRWTGSMGEGMVIGFDAIGHRTVGSPMAHLLGALFHETLAVSGARVELGEERLLHVNGTPREAFRPSIVVDPAEARPDGDPAVDAVLRALRSAAR